MKSVRLLCYMFLLAFFIVPDRAQSSLTIFEFPIIHCTLSAPQILHNLLS